MIVACLVAVATVAVAIGVMGPPSAQREAKLDGKRVRDLHRIADVIERHVQRNDALPPDLATLATQPGQHLAIVDPVDGSSYVYEITGEHSFRLCAVFATDTALTGGGGYPQFDGEWNHGAGRQCFDRRVKDTSGDG
jgi:hypothetical protein